MGGCGISQEEHNAVLAERDSARAQVSSLERQLKEKDIEIDRLEQQIRDLQGQSVADEPAPATSDGFIKIDAIDLHREGSENAIAAERKYKGQALEIRGTVLEVKRDYRGAYLSLEGAPEFIGWIDCVSPNGDWEEQISSVSKGQTVTIRGEWDKWSGYLLYLKNCSLAP